MSFGTPVLFLIFNRLDTTKQVFSKIRQIQPLRLYIASDGYRPEYHGEAEKVQKTRDYVIDQIDWDCEVRTLFQEHNLGCRISVSTAIDWFFENEMEGIILEDDCLPSHSFFYFCQELLSYYREDTRILTISGNNFLFGRKRVSNSYYFSRYNHCWGWATWKRAWKHYDVDLKLWPEIRDSGWLEDILLDRAAVIDWTNRFEAVYTNKLNTWDYQWTFSCWLQSSLSILPTINLVSNIGFFNAATHQNNQENLANIPFIEMQFPLKHPDYIIRDSQADCITQRTIFRSGFDLIVKDFIKSLTKFN
jgi:GR25 family glycosyltransferase involved in LPS biosynthesis